MPFTMMGSLPGLEDLLVHGRAAGVLPQFVFGGRRIGASVDAEGHGGLGCEAQIELEGHSNGRRVSIEHTKRPAAVDQTGYTLRNVERLPDPPT